MARGKLMKNRYNKVVVPWFSMNEWVAVHQLLYSQSTEDLKSGLARIVSWKARCPTLPVGVECSLGIAQVLSEDPDHGAETSISIAREQQLRLVYSTAVMRFLNLMLGVKKGDDAEGNMFFKAAQRNIPEWIVNLRHDAAHGVSLPDLSLLRTAALFIFKWLNENYWLKEMQLVTDWHVTEAEVQKLFAEERELQNIMETWEALSLYSLAGFHQLRLIPDNELMERITSIHQMLSGGNTGELAISQQIYEAKVAPTLKLLLRQIKRFFKNSHMGNASYMANSLVDGDFFLPSPSLMKILYPSGYDSERPLLKLPQAMANTCEGLLHILWNLGAIPELVSKLISVSCDEKDSESRRNIAALWVQKLLLSCLKVREAQRVVLAAKNRLNLEDSVSHYQKGTKKALLLPFAFCAVENQRSDLKEGYSWDSPVQIPNSLTSLDLVKQCFLTPSKFTSIFLPSFMELTSIPLRSRQLLLDLLDSANNFKLGSEESPDCQIFSVNDLSNVSPPEVQNKSSDSHIECTEPDAKSQWTISQDYLEWHKCPLGVLPWQREQDYIDQEECAGRQQQRTWPKLLMYGEWTKNVTENLELSGNVSNETALRRIKSGRVRKPYVKGTSAQISTPVKVLTKKRYSVSPGQKAIEMLSTL